MLMTHNYIDQSGATAYAAPEIEIYEMPAEGGFAGRVEEVGISQWGTDEDELTF